MDNPSAPRIGFVTCVHPFYDLPAITAHRDKAIAGLRQAACDVVSVDPPRSSADATAAAAYFKRCGVDLTLMFFCTWVAEDITLALATGMGGTPLLLWALPYLDKDVPMPSPISGITASGSNIRRLGKQFAHIVGPVVDEHIGQAARIARVAATIRKVSQARFGVVGLPCPGMVDVSVDEADMQRRFGVTTVHLELSALLEAAEQASGDEAAVLARGLISSVGSTEGVDAARVAESFRLYLGMKWLIEEHKLDAYCVRCWPELRDHHQKTICLAHSQLSQAGIPSTCEVDLPAVLTAYMLSQLAGQPAYSFDAAGYLETEDAVQLAHCGSAALSLAGDSTRATLRSHMRTHTGVTVEFAFPPATATLAKLMRPLDGRWRLFVVRATVLQTESHVRGSIATVRPEPSAKAFLDWMLDEGVEHHIVLAYGDWTRELGHFCRFTGIEAVGPTNGRTSDSRIS